MADYIVKMGIVLGNKTSFFACKVTTWKGILKAVPSVRVSPSRMRSNCKKLITATGLDPTEYATHFCKQGGALAALEAGLTDVQVQELDRWSSVSMMLRYTGNPKAQETLAEAVRI
jgi:hypothetical protein